MKRVGSEDDNSLRTQGMAVLRDLRTMIGESRPGRLLPSEWGLAHKYGISRNTVAKVFRILADEGLVDRQIGRGTLVKGKQVITFLLPCPDFLSSPHLSACIVRQRMQGAMTAAQERNLRLETIAVSHTNNKYQLDYSLLSGLNSGSMVILDDWFYMLFPMLSECGAQVAMLGKKAIPYGYAQYTKSWYHLK